MDDYNYLQTIAWQMAKATRILGKHEHNPAPIVFIKGHTWANTSMGFGGLAGNALCSSYVGVYGMGRYAVIFHGRRMAYFLDIHNPTCVMQEIYQEVPDLDEITTRFEGRCRTIEFNEHDAEEYVKLIKETS